MPCRGGASVRKREEKIMAKKGDQIYYDSFTSCADCACQAAKMLADALEHFDYSSMQLRMDEIHKIEHAADQKKHALTEELLRAFITPIEREDIAELSSNIDEVVDCLEDVLIRVYINNVSSIRPDAVAFARLLIRCCEVTKAALEEFPNFRKSKKLKELLIEISDLEEEGDRQFIHAMRALHTDGSGPIEIIAWREIYIYLEKCADACEHVADTVESVVMKNS